MSEPEDSPLAKQLAEGLRYQVTDFGPPAELASGGNFPSWANVAVVMADQPGQPGISLRLEVDDGRPVVTLVLVAKTPAGTPLEASMFHELPFDQIVDAAIEHAVVAAHVGELAATGLILDLDERATAIVDVTDRIVGNREHAQGARWRRQVDDSLLQNVGEIYSSDVTGAPTRAVADRLATGHRNAARWISLARERGFLPPEPNRGGRPRQAHGSSTSTTITRRTKR